MARITLGPEPVGSLPGERSPAAAKPPPRPLNPSGRRPARLAGSSELPTPGPAPTPGTATVPARHASLRVESPIPRWRPASTFPAPGPFCRPGGGPPPTGRSASGPFRGPWARRGRAGWGPVRAGRISPVCGNAPTLRLRTPRGAGRPCTGPPPRSGPRHPRQPPPTRNLEGPSCPSDRASSRSRLPRRAFLRGLYRRVGIRCAVRAVGSRPYRRGRTSPVWFAGRRGWPNAKRPSPRRSPCPAGLSDQG